jgi:hypothetical protein
VEPRSDGRAKFEAASSGGGIAGVATAQILVGADPSYMGSRYASELEPMARVDVGGRRPDLLCSFERTQGTIVRGFELKPGSDVMPAKQNLWHAGLLKTGFHSSAGGRASDFRQADDLWALEHNVLRMV